MSSPSPSPLTEPSLSLSITSPTSSSNQTLALKSVSFLPWASIIRSEACPNLYHGDAMGNPKVRLTLKTYTLPLFPRPYKTSIEPTSPILYEPASSLFPSVLQSNSKKNIFCHSKSQSQLEEEDMFIPRPTKFIKLKLPIFTRKPRAEVLRMMRLEREQNWKASSACKSCLKHSYPRVDSDPSTAPTLQKECAPSPLPLESSVLMPDGPDSGKSISPKGHSSDEDHSLTSKSKQFRLRRKPKKKDSMVMAKAKRVKQENDSNAPCVPPLPPGLVSDTQIRNDQNSSFGSSKHIRKFLPRSTSTPCLCPASLPDPDSDTTSDARYPIPLQITPNPNGGNVSELHAQDPDTPTSVFFSSASPLPSSASHENLSAKNAVPGLQRPKSLATLLQNTMKQRTRRSLFSNSIKPRTTDSMDDLKEPPIPHLARSRSLNQISDPIYPHSCSALASAPTPNIMSDISLSQLSTTLSHRNQSSNPYQHEKIPLRPCCAECCVATELGRSLNHYIRFSDKGWERYVHGEFYQSQLLYAPHSPAHDDIFDRENIDDIPLRDEVDPSVNDKSIDPSVAIGLVDELNIMPHYHHTIPSYFPNATMVK